MTKVINVHEAKAHLSEILERVRRGEEIILGKYGKPYARLIPVQRERVPLGFLNIRVPESFFEPLPEEELKAWEGSP
ncbi:MAG: type II toxin-antitoxin system prevent-host-death family antitoxin [Armatimonadota bacterium]|nr:type II toxin-antitoxin system prevent-host-death family antitoxin [Armatimonadota bacterium]